MNTNWVNSILFPLLIVFMETFWVYPWLYWVGSWPVLAWQRTPLSLISIIILMTVPLFATRLLFKMRRQPRLIGLIMVAAGLIAVLVVVRVEYGAGFRLLSGQWFVYIARILLDGLDQLNPMIISLVVAVYIWWRGISWGRSALYFNKIYRSFLIGIIALVILAVIWGLSSGTGVLDGMVATAGVYIAGFFFFGLTALALGNRHFTQLRASGSIGEGKQVFNPQWFYFILAVVGSIVLIAIGLSSIFSADLLALIVRNLSLAGDWLLQMLYYLFIPIGYLVQWLFYGGQFILKLILGTEKLKFPEPPEAVEPKEWQELVVPQVLSPEAVLALKWSFFAIVAVIVAFLLYRAVSRYWSARAGENIEETRESLWRWHTFKADLRFFLSMLWRWLKREKKQAVFTAPVPSWYTEENIPGHLDIREIYRHLMWEASGSGIPRRRQETAYEYAQRLIQAVPNGGQQLFELTDLYTDVRYGELRLRDKQIEHANSLWSTLRNLLHKLRGD